MRSRATALLVLPLALACEDTGVDVDPRCRGQVARLEVGEVVQRAGAGAAVLCVEDDGTGEYLYVPFFASESGTARLALQVTGEEVVPLSPPAAAGALAATGAPADAPVPDDGWHGALRRREIRDLEPRMAAARRGNAMRSARLRTEALQLGALVPLNVSTECDRLDVRTGRVVAVSATAVVVADTANPAGGFGAEDYASFAAAFDTLVHPVDVRNFGEPTDIDENGRAILFFTRAVNDLTPAGSDSYVGGFFWAGDLFPREECAGSNVAELFYLLVPDPAGEVNGNVRGRDFVAGQTVGVLGHEYQHLINASRRIYVNQASVLEEVWLNEALSHIAEELLFYEVTGLSPRANITREQLQGSRPLLQAFAAYAASNLARYRTYLQEPDTVSLLGVDDLPTRGASWAFLRYAADHEPGADADFFFRLVNAQRAGVANLSAALDGTALEAMQDWTVSVYADDAVPAVPPEYVQPSWNFRSVLELFSATPAFPLPVRDPSGPGPLALTLRAGGAAFVGFGSTGTGTTLLRASAEGTDPPEDLRVSLLRIR